MASLFWSFIIFSLILSVLSVPLPQTNTIAKGALTSRTLTIPNKSSPGAIFGEVIDTRDLQDNELDFINGVTFKRSLELGLDLSDGFKFLEDPPKHNGGHNNAQSGSQGSAGTHGASNAGQGASSKSQKAKPSSSH